MRTGAPSAWAQRVPLCLAARLGVTESQDVLASKARPKAISLGLGRQLVPWAAAGRESNPIAGKQSKHQDRCLCTP